MKILICVGIFPAMLETLSGLLPADEVPYVCVSPGTLERDWNREYS